MNPHYDPAEPRECDDCGAVSTVGELTPQKRLLDAPAIWVCPKCVATRGTFAATYQRVIDNGWAAARRAMEARL